MYIFRYNSWKYTWYTWIYSNLLDLNKNLIYDDNNDEKNTSHVDVDWDNPEQLRQNNQRQID